MIFCLIFCLIFCFFIETWYKVNYEEGSDNSLYSSCEWTVTAVDGVKRYRGKWGHTTEIIDKSDGSRQILMIGGDFVNGGLLESYVYGSQGGRLLIYFCVFLLCFECSFLSFFPLLPPS